MGVKFVREDGIFISLMVSDVAKNFQGEGGGSKNCVWKISGGIFNIFYEKPQ